MFKIVTCLLVFTLFLLFHHPVSADTQVVINEILADPVSGEREWVELYFPDTLFDISSYSLKDKANPSKTLSNLETCGKFAVFEVAEGWLNNSSEESVFLYDPNGNLVDSYENWQNPGEGKTLGRIPDGENSWQETQKPTRCSQNSQKVADPSPTPTSSPTPGTASTSTATPTSTPKASPTPAKSPTPKTTASPAVLGESQTESTPAFLLEAQSSPSSTPEATSSALSKTKVAGILAGSGIVLIGLSFGFYLWYKRILWSSSTEVDTGSKKILQKDILQKENEKN